LPGKEIIMRKIILILFATLIVGVAFYSVEGYAQMGQGYGPGYGMGPGMMGQGYGYGMGPGMMGPGYGYGYGMGPGMMGQGYGYGMGPGMMGPGYGMGPGTMGPGYGYGRHGYGRHYGPQYGRQYQQLQKPLDRNQAKQQVENYLSSLRNPNLKLGKIEEKGNSYQIKIETKNGSLVDKILVDKNTGWMRSAY
jgi:hypothetical protein